MPFKDKEIAQAYHQKYARANLSKTRTRYQEGKAQWNAYKATLCCFHCGEDNPIVLDFHHPSGSVKDNSVSKLVTNGAWRLVYLEAAKCEVLCSNCHRIHHHEERAIHKQQKLMKKKGLGKP